VLDFVGKYMESLVKLLFILLADIYTFSLKCQNFHWNVTGNNFYQLHLLFERIYETSFEDVDPIAEHTRGYGYKIPATQKSFQALSSVKELDIIPMPLDMVKILYEDTFVINKDLELAAIEATKFNKQGTLDLITGLIEKYQKIKYLLGSTTESI
jgi:starvation-inducible DNA-binding protein